MRVGRRQGVLAAVLLALAAVMAGVGPFVRARAEAEGARRCLDVRVGGVRLGWLAVRLVDVSVRPEGVEGVNMHADEVRVALGRDGRRVAAHGVSVVLLGTQDELRERLSKWRARFGGMPAKAWHHTTPVKVESMSLRWDDGKTAAPRLVVSGIDIGMDAGGVRLKVSAARLRLSSGTIAVDGAEGALDPAGRIVRGRAATLGVEWNANGRSVLAQTTGQAAREPAAPGMPLFAVPDLRAARATAAALSGMVIERIPQRAELDIDATTWKLSHPRQRVDLTVGPGPLVLVRSGSALELRFSTVPNATGTPLALRLTLATGGGDDTLALEGGPVSLAQLGIHEGAAGLVDVGRSMISGRGRIVLGDRGSVLTFDGEVATTDLSISDPRIASEVVRGLSLSLYARGAATDAGELRIDDFGAALGAVRVSAGGILDQQPDRIVGSFHFEIPTAPCQSLLNSVPQALLPALAGTEMAGTFGAHGTVAFDSRDLDQLALDYHVQDLCRMASVPPQLARARFEQPFVHQVYQPDGTLSEETTGPGSDEWTPLDEISPYMQVAVMTTEDGAFPKHHGFNRASIRASIIANLKARRFVRGASTITMQLAKNLFLDRKKTVSRKLEEVVLTDYLEQTFSKDDLMELYLNIIEFGPSVYGITDAADYYFGRSPAELNLAECLFLASVLPSPLRYGAMRDAGEVPESWMRTLHALMQIAHHNGRISDAELAEGEKETILFWQGGDRPPPRSPVTAHPALDGETDDVTTTPPPPDTRDP